MYSAKKKNNKRFPTTYDKVLSGLAENEEKQTATRPLYTWDYVQECTERCPAYHGATCHFDKGRMKRCEVMGHYIRGAADTIICSLPENEDVDPLLLWRVGQHLMPLYQMLGRMKIEEATFSRVIYTDDKGRRKANPIFKEIRETLKQVETTWRNLGLKGVAPNASPTFGPQGDPTTPQDYYSQMQEGQGRIITKKVRKKKNGNS